MPEIKQSEAMRQIEASWREAEAQLTVLREQVEHLSALAMTKTTNNVLARDLDRAYRDLGEALWAEVSKGKLTLPPNLSNVRKSLEQVTGRIREQNASINDLLSEGADIAKRLQEKMRPPSKGVAGIIKRR